MRRASRRLWLSCVGVDLTRPADSFSSNATVVCQLNSHRENIAGSAAFRSTPISALSDAVVRAVRLRLLRGDVSA